MLLFLDKKGGFFSISEKGKLVCNFGFSIKEHANGKKVVWIW